ncbi:hypothetical protein [Chryseobacterium candidae]|uniref:C1q domain-containing protein n=1 Tax=Chryseobacterium candidae TaxID=1978493 RepID=A0ABY2R9U1_9FLAO|nr:hypothetical protein [Chryseobacterium candidae]THV59381.1 hypothetical protein EK417_11160 [Chryseobacterium candidae]
MVKKIFFISTFFFSYEYVFSQVGINTTSPQATIDVKAKTTDGSKPEGLIPPRLTGDQISSADNQYGANQIGTIIYATAPVAVTTTKTKNITSAGYYYFDGVLWNKMSYNANVLLSVNQQNPTYIGNETVILDNNAGIHNIQLPAPSTMNGKILYYRNNSTASGVAGTATFIVNVPINNTTCQPNRGMTLYSDGTAWYVISGV